MTKIMVGGSMAVLCIIRLSYDHLVVSQDTEKGIAQEKLRRIDHHN
jgi:hypothetical protein